MSFLVVGDVIDDILVRPKTSIRPNTDTEASIQQSPGGSADNFACWLASLAKNTEVNFVGRVNQKDIARHQAVLESYGVRSNLQADPMLPTGSIVVLVEGNDRSFLTDRGANQNLDISQIPDSLFQDLVYISGYSLLSLDQKAIKDLIAKAHDHGALVACDPGSAGFIQDFGIKKFLDALEGVDILLPNLEEGRLLSGEDRPEVITAFLAERFSLVALTMGSEGCAIQGKDQSQFLQLAAPKAEVVDSTGAGDAFAAAFLKSYLETKDLEAAGKAGIRQGAIAVTLSGGRPAS
jgi:sugar/nucleoside kinase (ribokinase family)